MRPLLAAAAGILALVILAPALLATGSGSASSLSPQLADAPPGLVAVAFQAGAATGIGGNVLLAIAKIETDWGRARQAQPDELVPADIRAAVDAATLQAGGATAQLLGLPRRPPHRRLGEPAAGRRRARHGLHAVLALHLAHRGGRRARCTARPLPPARSRAPRTAG